MTFSEALSQVESFNNLVKKNLWLDFDVIDCSWQFATVHCGIDLSAGPDVELRFDLVFLAVTLMSWKTDTSFPVMRILTGDEAIRINKQFRVEEGHNLFTFQPEDLDESVRCVIAAQAFSWQVI